MRKFYLLISLVLASLWLFTFSLADEVAPSRQEIRIIIVSHGAATDPFWRVVKNGIDQAQKDLGVRVEYHAPQSFDMSLMSKLIDLFAGARPDGMIVTIPDAEALGPAIQKATAMGIPVISMNSGSDAFKSLGVLRHVGQTEYEAGFGGGQFMADAGGTVGLCVNHEPGNIALDLRCQGFADGLGKDITVLGVSPDSAEIEAAVARALDANPNINTILAAGPVSAEPTLKVLRDRGLIQDISLGCFDLSPTVLSALSNNEMSFAIDQQQWLQGYLAVTTLVNYIQYGLLPGNDIILTGPGFVTPENAAQVITLSQRGIR
ncbi:MAG: sugar ABC transporter substrate-binding protein [Deinococcales bacterium]